MSSVPLAGQSPVTISIVTPCYNGAKFLEETIQCAVSQSAPPIEIIVIDDGSTDDSASIAERFGPPVRVLRQANQGESVARNRGIAAATGSHVLFLDADDLLAPDALEMLSRAAATAPDALILMGCARFTQDPLRPLSIVPAAHKQFYPDVIHTNFGPPHCWLAPLDAVRQAGGFCETMQWSEDWDMLWRIGLHLDRVVPLDYVGAYYRQHPDSQFARNSMANRCRGHAAIMARMTETLFARPDILDRHGTELLWGGCTAIVRARAEHVPWKELASLTTAMRTLASNGPRPVRATMMARLICWFGVKTALTLQKLTFRN